VAQHAASKIRAGKREGRIGGNERIEGYKVRA
jgi:hypothetical protein